MAAALAITCKMHVLHWLFSWSSTLVMPRSQPAVRVTALACLVLRRGYVSNATSPVADWGLKVILQPVYRQRTSLAVAVPPTHRIARRQSHSESTFNVLAPCLRGTFNVRSPCHRPRVRTAVCVCVPQWHGAAPPTCVAGTVWAAGKCKFNASRDGLNQDFFISWTKRVGQLRWLPCRTTSLWLRVLITSHVLLSAPFISHFSCWQKHFLLLPYFGLRTFCWSWWADRFPPRLFADPYPSFWVPSPHWADDNAWDYIF